MNYIVLAGSTAIDDKRGNHPRDKVQLLIMNTQIRDTLGQYETVLDIVKRFKCQKWIDVFEPFGFAQIYRNASIASGTIIGERVRIGAGVKIASGVQIGNGVQIAAGVKIASGVQIGQDVTIYRGASIGREVLIRDRTIIGRNVKIGNAIPATTDTESNAYSSGWDVFFQTNFLQNDGYRGHDWDAQQRVVIIGREVQIGHGASIGQGSEVGDNAKIGERACLAQEVGDNYLHNQINKFPCFRMSFTYSE